MQYISLLRGINVSGQKLIKMENLRELYQKSGFTGIQTYIQSGNVVFENPETEEEILERTLEEIFHQAFNFTVKTFIRNFYEWEEIIRNNPFEKEYNNPDYKLYISFFKTYPDPKLKEKISLMSNSDENFVFINKELYILIRKELTKQLFSNNYIEQKLKIPATTRNWNTVLKLMEYKSN